jgi:hypothetical protein
MSKFQVGDYVESTWNHMNVGVESRQVTRVSGTEVNYLKTFKDGRTLEIWTNDYYLNLVSRPSSPPESFRKVFCAWTGKSESKVQKARARLLTDAHSPDATREEIERAIDELIVAVKEES